MKEIYGKGNGYRDSHRVKGCFCLSFFFLMWKRREREVGVKDLGNLTGSSKYTWGISPGEAESVFIK